MGNGAGSDPWGGRTGNDAEDSLWGMMRGELRAGNRAGNGIQVPARGQ